MAAATALSSAPFLLSCRRHYRRCTLLFPSITGGRLINNRHSQFTPLVLNSNPIDNGQSASLSLSSSSRGRKGTQFLCYCTGTEAEAGAGAVAEAEKVNTGGVKEAANSLDIRVGRIVKAWRHEEADSLYVEEVDVGESEPRTICSGLVKYIPLHLLQERNVVVLANLKPRNMRGVKSFGMLMAASDASHENVELLVPPEGALPGDRVWFGSIDDKDNLPDVASPNQASLFISSRRCYKSYIYLVLVTT
ncbi:Nucleic acid-binding, partial [Perilla frutescens var. hirtella]